MGTSSARKAPVGKFWRTAKTAVARFASGKEASPPMVQEVVARYLTALTSDSDYEKEAGKNFLPVITRAAGSLGNFYRLWEQEGWEAALKSLNLTPHQTKTDIIPAILDRLMGPGNNLEEAVARSALIDDLEYVLSVKAKFPPAQNPTGSNSSNNINKVSHFLGLALYRKLLSDLGESLEFHAPTVNLGNQRQEEIRSHILASIQALEPADTTDAAFSPDRIIVVLDQILTRLGRRDER